MNLKKYFVCSSLGSDYSSSQQLHCSLIYLDININLFPERYLKIL